MSGALAAIVSVVVAAAIGALAWGRGRRASDGEERSEAFDHRALERAGAMSAVREPELYWLYADRLAGGPWPSQAALDWLAAHGVTVLVNLTESPYDDRRFQVHQISIADMDAPSPEQIEVFCRLVADVLACAGKAYVHCVGGIGRTGTMMACLLVQRDRVPWMQAIDRIRSLRPGSVEASRQEDAVAEWESRMEARDFKLG